MRENNLMTEKAANFFEETSIKAMYLTLFYGANIVDMNLLIAEIPKILKLKYSAVKDVRSGLIELIQKMLDGYRIYNMYAWKKFVDLKYLVEMLKNFDDAKK